MAKHTVAAMLIIETDDDRLDPNRLDVSSASKTRRLREAIVANLGNMTRVVFVSDEETARLMCIAHEYAAHSANTGIPQRPPGAYVAPQDRR